MLEELLPDMPEDVPVVLDAKRGDIGETQKYYAQAYLNAWRGCRHIEPLHGL